MWFTVTCVYSSFIASNPNMGGYGIFPLCQHMAALQHKDSGHTMIPSHTEILTGSMAPKTGNTWVVEEEESLENIQLDVKENSSHQ